MSTNIEAGQKFCRVHGDRQQVTVKEVKDGMVEISDKNGTHFIPVSKFTEENFK